MKVEVAVLGSPVLGLNSSYGLCGCESNTEPEFSDSSGAV